MNKKIDEKMLKKIFIGIIVVIVVIFAISFGNHFFGKKKIISSSEIQKNLENMSELATSKMLFRGIVRYEEGAIKYITKKGFTVIYDATVKAGVELEDAKVDVKGKNINIDLPMAQILDIDIDSDSLQFYDEQKAIFNWQDKEDLIEVMKYIEKDVLEKVDKTDLKDVATNQTKLVLEGFLSPFTEEKEPYKINIKFE